MFWIITLVDVDLGFIALCLIFVSFCEFQSKPLTITTDEWFASCDKAFIFLFLRASLKLLVLTLTVVFVLYLQLSQSFSSAF